MKQEKDRRTILLGILGFKIKGEKKMNPNSYTIA
jgi:hypothetical protein